MFSADSCSCGYVHPSNIKINMRESYKRIKSIIVRIEALNDILSDEFIVLNEVLAKESLNRTYYSDEYKIQCLELWMKTDMTITAFNKFLRLPKGGFAQFKYHLIEGEIKGDHLPLIRRINARMNYE